MNTQNITSPSPGWFRIDVTPTSVMTEAGHFVVGESVLIPVGPNQITPADLVAIAITAVGESPAKPALVKALEALTGDTGKRKRSPKEEAGQPTAEQVEEPKTYGTPPWKELMAAGFATPTTEGGAE